MPASGSTQRNVPLRPKWPIGARRVQGARPVRRLAVAQLEAEAPVVRVLPAEARDDADEPRELNGARFVERLLRDPFRMLQLVRERYEVAEAAPRRPNQRSPRAPHPSPATPTRSTPGTASRRALRRARPQLRSRSSNRCAACQAVQSARRARTGARKRAPGGGGASTRVGRRARPDRRFLPLRRRASPTVVASLLTDAQG